MRLTLIDDWRHGWRFLTVIGAAALSAFDFAMTHLDVLEYLLEPDTVAQLAAVLPPDRLVEINKWAALALIVLRMVRQKIPARDAAPAPAAPASPTPGAPQ